MTDFKLRLIDMDLNYEFTDSEFNITYYDYEILKIAINSGPIKFLNTSNSGETTSTHWCIYAG